MNRRSFVVTALSATTLRHHALKASEETPVARWNHTSQLFGNAWELFGTAKEGSVEIVSVGLEDGFRVSGIVHNNTSDVAFVTGFTSSYPDITMFPAWSTVQYLIPLGGYALFSTTLQLGVELDSTANLPELAVEWVSPLEAEEQYLHMYETVELAVVDFSVSNDHAKFTLQNMYDADAVNSMGMILRLDAKGSVINQADLIGGETIRAGATRKLQHFIPYDATPDDIFLVGFFGHVA